LTSFHPLEVHPIHEGTFKACEPTIGTIEGAFVLRFLDIVSGFFYVNLQDLVVYLMPETTGLRAPEFVNTSFESFWNCWTLIRDSPNFTFEQLCAIDTNPLMNGSMWDVLAEEAENFRSLGFS
jgi:hypothetical protein